MAPINKDELVDVLTNGPTRQLAGGKRLTLVFGGLYIAETKLPAKPQLIWEGTQYYARYYIPVESLHPAIKSAIEGNASQDKKISVEKVESVKGKGNDSEAVIERLTVGSRSTNWARVVEGPLKGYVRFESDEIDQWFENGGIFKMIKNPFKRIDTTPISSHIVVKIDGQEVAETDVAVLLNETGLKDAYYLPATSIKDWGAVEKNDWRTVCPYKGEASYFDINVNGKKHEKAVWYYPYPTHESAGVAGFVSFYNREGIETFVDGIKV